MKAPTRDQIAAIARLPDGKARIENLREQMERQHAEIVNKLRANDEACRPAREHRDICAEVLADIAAVTGGVRA